MELTERETLIKVEQQLQDSVKNQATILSDIKEFFNRIETESKFIASTNAELKSYKEASAIRWTELEKKLTNLQKIYDDNATAIDKLFDITSKGKEERIDAINKEQQERIDAINKERQERKETLNVERQERIEADNEESKSRELFQETITASFRTTKVICGVIAIILTIVIATIELARK